MQPVSLHSLVMLRGKNRTNFFHSLVGGRFSRSLCHLVPQVCHIAGSGAPHSTSVSSLNILTNYLIPGNSLSIRIEDYDSQVHSPSQECGPALRLTSNIARSAGSAWYEALGCSSCALSLYYVFLSHLIDIAEGFIYANSHSPFFRMFCLPATSNHSPYC